MVHKSPVTGGQGVNVPRLDILSALAWIYLFLLCFQSWPTETVSAVRRMLSVKYTDKNAGRFCISSPRRLKASLCSPVLSCGGSYWQWNRRQLEQLELWHAIKNSWCWCSPKFEFLLNEHKHSVINDEGHARKDGKWVSCLRLHDEFSTRLTVSIGDFVGETAPLCVNITMKHAFTCLSEKPVFSPLLTVEVPVGSRVMRDRQSWSFSWIAAYTHSSWLT